MRRDAAKLLTAACTGAPGRIRTPDRRIRNPMLYPPELLAPLSVSKTILPIALEQFRYAPAAVSASRFQTPLCARTDGVPLLSRPTASPHLTQRNQSGSRFPHTMLHLWPRTHALRSSAARSVAACSSLASHTRAHGCPAVPNMPLAPQAAPSPPSTRQMVSPTS